MAREPKPKTSGAEARAEGGEVRAAKRQKKRRRIFGASLQEERLEEGEGGLTAMKPGWPDFWGRLFPGREQEGRAARRVQRRSEGLPVMGPCDLLAPALSGDQRRSEGLFIIS